ncbi:hypothetical protein C8258_08920 [Nocardia sp. MDA0666]|uniref:hypothetical protein n=1 Tax=Nocardia sp. MDA0666 TaxID=2135448 RepID=UPI000D126E80|nr:hypothetical protein [Nocardia sp. MDA0666]PSR68619.1 hypothetical protein C8258_08920 [Nocardia sp. MDA0666]
MDFLDRHIADRIAWALGCLPMDVGQVVAQTGLAEASIANQLITNARLTVSELVLIACALDRDPVDFIPGITAAQSEVA